MNRPTKKQIAYAKSVIAAMRSFIEGRTVQRKGRYLTNGRWEDFDLGMFINDGALEYRPKPARK